MVSVTKAQPGRAATPAIRPDQWLKAVTAGRPEAEAEIIRRACLYAQQAHTGQTRVSGGPFTEHLLAVAQILADLRLDHETIAAALLHDIVEDTPVTLDNIGREFGPRIARLVDGVTKMAAIPERQDQPAKSRDEHAQAESLRKMLLAMAEDVRVVLIKLADRLHNMRTLGALSPEKQRRIARETMDIFAPLANRLGIWQIKWELEDLSFRYLEPASYRRIAGWLAERRIDREKYVARFVEILAGELKQAGVNADVTGRPKHIYGIWRKMRRTGKDFARITDVRGVRVLVESIRDCYAALGIVHTAFRYIPGEFDDYIATPKENNYRSIHTAIIGPEGKMVEVQIRTHEMHQQAEFGVAAHWRYKEGVKPDESFDQKITWLRQLLEWKDEVAEADEFVDQFKSEMFSERVYVLTPKGNIVDLPKGATPLDFAYHIHTDIGHHCRGAKVNGRIAPLTYRLKTGQQVEVLTVKKGGPSRDWLNPDLGYLHTSKARSKVSHWFRQQNFESSVASGREVLEREFNRLGISDTKYETLTKGLGFNRAEDFLAAVGRGDIKPSQIVATVRGVMEPSAKESPGAALTTAHVPAVVPTGVTVQGVGNLLTRFGKCCNPVPGDSIVGFITRGSGVTIHRRDCPNVLWHHDEHGERLIQVGWGAEIGRTYPVEIEIIAYERSGLLRDIASLLANEKVNVIGVSTATDKTQHMARMTFTIEIPDLDTLSRVLAMIDQVPNVTDVRRRVH